ncbi:MAG: DUF1302 family protein [Myxococcota bacterium]
MRRATRLEALALSILGLAAAAPSGAQPKLVSPDQGFFRVNGFVEAQIRTLSDGFEPGRYYLSQSALVLNVEPELDILTDTWGPFDNVSAFARVEFRYDCVHHGCGTIGTSEMFGNRAKEAPARNWADAPTLGSIGGTPVEEFGGRVRRVHGDDVKLLPITSNPTLQPFYDIGISQDTVENAFGPRASDVFAWKRIDGPTSDLALPLGPWRYSDKIRPIGALVNEESSTLPLPLRPETGSLFTPSPALAREAKNYGSFDQNFGGDELAFNRGASQDEWELKEAYLDIEMFDSRLWIRAGKQNIVWGKTELFRTTDQFNPVDIGLASLPSLEESRVALWSLRGVYSFYDVGPLDDVRLELALNFDDFEPIDTGRCGEPYTVWLICVKSTALWAHGTTGTGLAGERRPPDPWESQKGLEFGGRLEFRWSRFSFAITDFYGFDDVPTIRLFNEYERNVDPATGRPLDSEDRALTPDNALQFASGNRQIFDVGCKAAQGFGENALLALTGGLGEVPDISERCIGDVVNVQDPLSILFGAASIEVPPTNAIGALLSGQIAGSTILGIALFALDLDADSVSLTPLNRDPADGPHGGGVFGADPLPGFGILANSDLSYYLTDEQEALLGCGPYYMTDCDVEGIDLFNAEASVLLQGYEPFEPNPVATRVVDGRTVILPGARGPGDPGYDPLVDGTPPGGFDSEMAALSENLLVTLAVLGIAEGDDDCELDDLETCAAVRALVALSGSRRPELRAGGNGRYGRRDWGWHGGGEVEITYDKRNVLGFSADFSEDVTKSNWAMEFTWVDDADFASNRSSDLTQQADVFNLTISVDRPTFINFLNANRTFFFNSQVFFRYIPDHDSSFDTHGPFTALLTFTVLTGYYNDRLLPAMTFVHDVASESGGMIWQLTYRYDEAFSITAGVLNFYGSPKTNRLPQHPVALPDTQTSFSSRTRYQGLSAIAERDEIFLRLRYTF